MLYWYSRNSFYLLCRQSRSRHFSERRKRGNAQQMGRVQVQVECIFLKKKTKKCSPNRKRPSPGFECNVLSETRVSEGLSCSCVRPSAIRVWGLKLFVCEAFSYYLKHVISYKSRLRMSETRASVYLRTHAIRVRGLKLI